MKLASIHAFAAIILSVIFYMQTGVAIATEITPDCGQVNEQIILTVRFQGMSESASSVQAKIKEMENKVISIGKGLGIKGMKSMSQNFNLSSMQGNSGNGYRYSGGSNFQVKPYDSAIKLADALKSQGYQISLAVNRYPVSGCSH